MRYFVLVSVVCFMCGCGTLSKFADDYGYYSQDPEIVVKAQEVGKKISAVAEVVGGVVGVVDAHPIAVALGTLGSGIAAVVIGRRKKKRG